YDVAEGNEVKSLPGHTGAVSAVMFTPKGDEILTAAADKTIQRFNASDFSSKGKLEHAAAVSSLSVNKDGTKVAAGGASKTVRLGTLADGKAAETINPPAEVKSVGFSPDGGKLIVAGADNRARIYNLDGTMAEFFPHEGPVLSASWHSGGKNIATASADKT